MAEANDTQAKAHAPIAPEATNSVDSTAVPDMFAATPTTATTVTGVNHEKNYVKTLLFSAMFGYFGVDRFYLGKIGTGVLKIVTFGGLGIWVLVDFIVTLVGGAREKGKETLELEDTTKYKPFFVRLTLVMVGIYIAILVLELLFVFVAMPKFIQKLTPADKRYELVCVDRWNNSYVRLNLCPEYNWLQGNSPYSNPDFTKVYEN